MPHFFESVPTIKTQSSQPPRLRPSQCATPRDALRRSTRGADTHPNEYRRPHGSPFTQSGLLAAAGPRLTPTGPTVEHPPHLDPNHGVRLARPRLPVREDRRAAPAEHVGYERLRRAVIHLRRAPRRRQARGGVACDRLSHNSGAATKMAGKDGALPRSTFSRISPGQTNAYTRALRFQGHRGPNDVPANSQAPSPSLALLRLRPSAMCHAPLWAPEANHRSSCPFVRQ